MKILIRTKLKALCVLGLGLILAPMASTQDSAPPAPFSWNAPTGQVKLVQRADLMHQILAGETVTGSFILTDCRPNGRFEPGFRLILQTGDQKTSVFPGFTCIPETGQVYVGQSSIVKDGVHTGLQRAEFLDRQIGETGERIGFSIRLEAGMVHIESGNVQKIYPVDAHFEMAFFAAVASEGMVVFAEEATSLG